MSRHLISALVLFVAAAPGFARGGRKPGSAIPPPLDWAAIREEGEKEIGALLVPWLDARKAMLVACAECDGAGVVPDPERPGRPLPCPDCGACGFLLGQGFDPAAVDALLFSPGNRSAYWAKIRERPVEARRIAVADFRVREVRVLGDFAYAMVQVRPVPFRGEETVWLPEVTTWYRISRRWRVLDPDRPPPIIDMFPQRTMPERFRPKPEQEPGALAALRRAEDLLPARPRREEIEGLTFRVAARGADPARELVLTAELVGARFQVRQKPVVFARRADPAGRRAAEVTRRLLDLLLSREEALVPAVEEFHLERLRGAVVMRGFSPSRFMETVTVEIGADGLPSSVTRERPGRPTVRIAPRFEVERGQALLAGGVRIEGDERLEFAVEWRKGRGLRLPRKAEVRAPGGLLSLVFTPSRPVRVKGF